MNIRQAALQCAAAGLGALILCGAAQAHAQLVLSVPSAGSTVDASPKLIQLTLSEALDRRFSGLELTDRDGRKIETTPVATTNLQAIVVSLPSPLVPGMYRVTWHAVASDDGHRTEGIFSFKVH